MIADLKPYPKYKESGLPWIGSVPEHWSQRRMKFLFTERVQKGFPDEPLLAATQTKGVIRKEDYGTRTVTAQKDFHLLKLVEPGDFVISLRSFEGGIEAAHTRGIISPAYTVLAPKPEACRTYFTRFFKSSDFIRSLSLFVTGIREGQNIDYERLSRAFMPLPPVNEQKMIGRFLDHTNRRLERTIRAKRKVIALLNEQKQAIIHRAVTRGLDPNDPLKPSGIPWLGDIPKHWEVSRVKNEFTCLNPRRIPLSSVERGKMTAGLYDYYGASGVIDKVDNFLFDDDLLLIAEDGANLVLRNLPLAIIARGKFWVNNHAHILKPKRGSLEYLAGFMETLNYQPWISGAAQPKLTKNGLMSIAIAVAPPTEQPAIVEHFIEKTAPLCNAISRTEREIALLREYRTRLVADVVTGKLDVREAAIILPEEADVPEPLDGIEALAEVDDLADDTPEEDEA
ncbi:MAG TPA: restriction endonuclease subunit S [Candidatus Binatia bacterium]|nr:restriction endonuclease subunit S [Candidatus Binatia bacterium]